LDIARGEMVEKELDAMIERRSRQKDPDEEHELWRSSVTAYNARRSEELRAAWWRVPLGAGRAPQGRFLEALIARHEAAAERLTP
jgi:hypothetical protein